MERTWNMMNKAASKKASGVKSVRLSRIIRDRWMYFMLIPGVLYYLLFRYGPMVGLVSAFQNYQPFLGFFRSPFVGMKHFDRFFHDPQFWMLLRNTLIFGFMNLFLYFPIPIIVSLLLNEIRSMRYKNAVQSLIYIPHLVSWVVVYSITYTLFTTEGGVINNILAELGMPTIAPLVTISALRPMILFQIVWKETGYGTIIFLAAIAGVDPTLYEAAKVDGAGRWQQMVHITWPAIRSTVVTMLILRTGYFLDTGFEQLLLMINATNRTVGETFDTYIYEMGIKGGQFSYTAAVGFFKSIIALILVLTTNFVAKRAGEDGLF